ncbi:Nitric oxide-responding transcriptional regulator Dnr (Crp/Fnr family) [hydrothermal vent metagenome]|uniref:Nitric oxide-responding transcriptional regulator Dnr (Crp/Fnr family) n=1 Tax=hydrothermal vent metagenome TaxID=652676 RepID=A0A1W1BA77_9ZZZZ
MISTYKKMWIRVLLLLVLLMSSIFAIEIQNLSVAVDVAGKQRMFTQRILKDYAMIGLENSFGNPKEDIKKIFYVL